MSHGKKSLYYLPCKPGSVYVNVTNTCLNNCLFCIKRDGSVFFGADLSLDKWVPEPLEIVEYLENLRNWENVKEVVFCGMGEPLLRYDCVRDTCRAIRESMDGDVSIRVDTSGLFWAKNKRLDILDWIDVLSISLNAENVEKYEKLCQPTIPGAYGVLKDFLRAVKIAQDEGGRQGKHFPEVRLSVVDTSEEEFVPKSGRKGFASGTFPIPDVEACRKIASKFGWPLVVKRLFRDSCDDVWNDPEIQEMCARGIPLKRCQKCTYRH